MDFQQKYFSKDTKGDIVAAIISDIVTGHISKDELVTVVSKLKEKGYFENSKKFNMLNSSYWNENYLNELRFKIDCLSPEYFNHLYEVSRTVRDRKKLHENAVRQFRLIVAGVCTITLLLLIFGIRSCSKRVKAVEPVETVISDINIDQNEGEKNVDNSIQ